VIALAAREALVTAGKLWSAGTTGVAPPSTQPAAGSGQGPEWGEAAPIGLLIILLMGGALFLLIKSMNRNLRRVPASFDEPAMVAGPDGSASPARTDPERADGGARASAAAGGIGDRDLAGADLGGPAGADLWDADGAAGDRLDGGSAGGPADGDHRATAP
jgi:hypothetical protein